MDVSMALEAVKPRICWGVKARGGSRRFRCGEEVNDSKIIDEVNRLINEFLNRVEMHKGVLLSDSNTPFDESIKALSDWLPKIKGKINESNDEAIINLRRAMIEIGRKMLKLAEEAREKWLRVYKSEFKELVERLGSNEVRIVISGDPFNKSKSFTVHLHTKNLVIDVERVAKSDSVTIILHLTGLGGAHIVTPKLLDDGKLKAMRYGLLLTDGAISKKGYPEMSTNQLWQVVAWPLAWPGKNHVHIRGVGVNGDNVSVTWYLRANDHKGEFESKAVVAEQASKLNNEGFLTFLLFAILGDGNVNVEEKAVRLYMGRAKHKAWGGLIDRLKDLGFREYDGGRAINYEVWSSKAVELAKRMLGESSIKALIEDLGLLPDAEKLKNLITLAGMRSKPLGRSSVEVAGVRMNVHVSYGGSVELRTERDSLKDAKMIQEKLKNAGYNAKLREYNGRLEVYIGQDEMRKHPELMTKACEILRRMLNEAVSEGKIKRTKAIIKAMKNLNSPPTQKPTDQTNTTETTKKAGAAAGI